LTIFVTIDMLRGRSGGRHCTAGQSCYTPLWRHLVFNFTTPSCTSSNEIFYIQYSWASVWRVCTC